MADTESRSIAKQIKRYAQVGGVVGKLATKLASQKYLGVKLDKEKAAYFKQITKYDSKLTFQSLNVEKTMLAQDAELREKRDRWHRDLAKDVYVEEAVNVLQDLKIRFTNPLKLASVKG